MSGMRLDVNELVALCSLLSSLTCLTSLDLSGNVVVDATTLNHVDDRDVTDALGALLTALPALRHLHLPDVDITDRLGDIPYFLE